jgi:hypothetical protein
VCVKACRKGHEAHQQVVGHARGVDKVCGVRACE